MNQKLVRLQFLITIVLYPFPLFKLLQRYEYSLNYFPRSAKEKMGQNEQKIEPPRWYYYTIRRG